MPEKPIDELFIDISAKETNANKTISAMATSLNNLAGSLEKIKELSNLTQNIRELVAPIEKTGKNSTNQLKALASGLRSLNSVKSIEPAVKNVEGIYEALSKFDAIPDDVKETIVALGSLAKNVKSVQSLINKSTSQKRDNNLGIEDDAEKSTRTIYTLGQAVNDLKAKFKATSFGNAFSKLKERLASLRDGTTKLNLSSPFDAIKSKVESLKDKFSSVKERLGGFASSIKEKFNSLRSEDTKLDFGKAFDSLKSKARDSIENVKDKLKNINLAGAKEKFSNLGKNIKDALGKGAEGAKEKLKKLKFSDIAKGVAAIPKAFAIATKGVIKFGKAVGSAVKGAISKVKDLAGKFKELTKKIIPGAEAVGKFGGQFKKLFSRIVVMGLLRRGFSQMLSAMKDGIGNVAKSVDSYNKSMSTIATSTNYMKNALSASLAPILKTIAPIIDEIADKFVKLTEIVSQVVAKLTGQSTYVRAIKTQVNYADSLDSTSKSAKDASNSINEYKKSLQGFDQINQLPSPKNEDSSSNSNADGYKFEEVKVAESGIVGQIGQMIDDIKEALSMGDFSGAGSILATSLSGVIGDLNALDWDGIDAKVTKWASNISSAINGFLGSFDFDGFGNLVGNALDTLLTFATELTNGIDWTELGAGIAGFFTGITEALDPKKVGEMLTDELKIITETLDGFFNGDGKNKPGFDFSSFGNWVGEALIGAIENVDWSKFGSNISSAISGLFKTITGVLTAKDENGKGVLEKVIDSINDAFKGFDAKEVRSSISTMVNTLFDSLKEAIKNLDVDEISQDFADLFGTLADIDWKKVGQTLSDAIKKGLDVAIDTLWKVFESGDANKAGEGVTGFFLGIDWAGIIKKVLELIGAAFLVAGDFVFGIFEGLGKGISDWWDTNGEEWFKEHITDKITQSKPVEFIVDAKEKVQGKLTEIKDNVSELWNNGKDRVANVLADAKEKAGSKLESIKSGFNSVFGKDGKLSTITADAKEKAGSKLESIKSSFSSIFGKNGKLSTITANAKEKAKSKLSSIKDNMKYVFGKNGKVSSVTTELKEKGKKTLKGAKDALGELFGKDGKVATFTATLKDGFSSVLKNIISAIIDVLNFFIEQADKVIPGKQKKINKDNVLKMFADGGFPQSGQMFVARENGMPEMVGRFGNQTMVANNQQIVDGISKGVYNAMMSANSVNRNNASQNTTQNINLKVDGRTLNRTIINNNSLRARQLYGV